MSSPSPPKCIDPEDILAFASTCPPTVPEEPTFQELFSTLFTPSSTSSILSPCVRMYIVRQPVPAKHRRSYVEVRDLRNLCGRSNPSLTSENDLKDAVIVMKKVSWALCGDHQGRSPALPVPPLCDTTSPIGEWNLADRRGLGGEASSGTGSGYSSLTEDSTDCSSGTSAVLASGALRVPIEIFEPQAFSQSGLRNPDVFVSSDDDEGYEDDQMDDESEGEDGNNLHLRSSTGDSSETIKPSRKVRRLRSNPRNTAEEVTLGPYQCIPATLPSRFRPLVQDGEVQFETWVVAFLMTPSSASSNGSLKASKQVLIDPQQQGASPTFSSEQRPALVNLPHSMPLAATEGNTTVITIMNQPSERQRQISNWIERVAQFLGTHILQSFIRNEVAHSRIGIDFKKILQEKKMRPQRRVVH